VEIEKDKSIWAWVSFAPEYRLILDISVGFRTQQEANTFIAKTASHISNIPFFLSDGLSLYTGALLETFGHKITFSRSGKRGRPKKPIVIPDENLKYGQVVKVRQGNHLVQVVHRAVIGQNIDPHTISTSLIERQNLTFRQENNRVSRKTIGFSKKIEWLSHQMTLYCTYFNFCRLHRGLTIDNGSGVRVKRSPALAAGIIDHVWSVHELFSKKIFKTPTN
jgi:IS1 family transposase